MENASKALIMAASVMLGVMILSIGVYIFSIFGQYSQSAHKKLEASQIDEFNSQFLKYYGIINRTYTNDNGKEENVQEPIECTAHDIISIANLAEQNNVKYNLNDLEKYDKTTYYVQIDVYDKKAKQKLNENIQKKWEENDKLKFLNENSNQNYKCSEILISEYTKRVCYMKFEKLYN